MRSQLETAIAIIVRTPGLFIIDYWWQTNTNKSINNKEFFSTFVTNLALINGLLLLLLPLSFIRSLYTHTICAALLLSAHLLSHYFVNVIDMNTGLSLLESLAILFVDTNAVKQVSLLAVHVIIAVIVSCLLQGSQKPLIPVLACYSLPVLARILDFSSESLQFLHNFSCALVILSLIRYAYYSLPSVCVHIKGAYSDLIHLNEAHDLASFLVVLGNKLFVPTHFLLFWSIAFFMKLYEYCINGSSNSGNSSNWYVVILSAASSVCTSPVSLFSTAVMVTYMSYFILSAMKFYLWGHSTPTVAALPNTHPHTGWEEGMTTLLLAILTGITDLKQQARMAVLTIILFVVLSSLLQSMLEIAEPVILSLSAYNGKNIVHHVKILFLCVFLFLFPLHVTWVLAHIFPVDFWMAVVLSTSVLTSAQVADLMIVHCLIWYDATRSEPWESLDEAVYYVRGFTKIIEFIVATSVVVVGVWEGITGHWSLTNAFILLVHCYFNVWQRLHFGFRSFIRRREAIKKTASLITATSNQLSQHNDICAICFTNMVSNNAAIVTNCNHFFHRSCLRKWLCFQDRCPLCTTSITLNESNQSNNETLNH